MSVRKLALAIASAALLQLSVDASAGSNYQHSHSLESDLHDVRELGSAIRRRASEPVGWRDERGVRDPLVRIKLIGFNDFHGRLAAGQRVANRPVGGIGVLASYLRSAAGEARDGHLFIHAGDHVGATPPESALLQDEPSIQFLNQLANDECRYADPRKLPSWLLTFSHPRCDVVGTPGNHEFDEGVAEMLRLIGGGNHAKGPFLQSPYRGALFTIQPFSNDLVSMDLTGAQVRTLLEQQWVGQARPRLLKTSSIWYRWQACPGYNPNVSPFCQSGLPQVLDMRIGGPAGTPIDVAATYRVTVNSFMASGGDNYLVLPQGTNRVVGAVDLDALVDYVEQDLAGNVVAAIEGRIIRE
ncbi:MAG TPA: 5'-nucleotidase C-terminal domain-containing protein [Steroidobacteraceae bacterium]|nr:5'-nucleotidase C-terminal domain-containing protein [Steroidobacteraceae bacterium]